MKSTGLTLLAILSSVLAGCGGGGSGGGSSSSSGLMAESVSIADFNVVSTIEFSESQLADEINGTSIFYNRMPSSGGISARSECIKNMEDQLGSISKDGSFYRFTFEEDIKNCNSDASDLKSEVTSRFFRYWSATKNGSQINLSNYKVNSIPSYDYSTNLLKYYREKIWNNNNKYIASSLTSSVSNPEEYCDWTPANVDDCEVRTKWVYYYNNDLQTVTDIYLVKYRWNNVSSASGATYHSSGSMSFRIANWSGTMVFWGATTPSTYTASNGSQTITGTLDPSGVSQVVYQDSPTSLY